VRSTGFETAAQRDARIARESGVPTAAQSQQQWISNVASTIGTVANTSLALIQGALASDAAARTLAATEAAARLAAAASDAERAGVAVGAAELAYQKARTGGVMLSSGDRAGATTKLSEAQGSLAAAVTARGYFEQLVRRVPPLLPPAIDRAAAEIDRLVDAITASAIAPPAPTMDNPLARIERGPCAPTPLQYGGGAVAGAALGFVVAGPMGAVIGAVVGGGAGYLYGQQACAT